MLRSEWGYREVSGGVAPLVDWRSVISRAFILLCAVAPTRVGGSGARFELPRQSASGNHDFFHLPRTLSLVFLRLFRSSFSNRWRNDLAASLKLPPPPSLSLACLGLSNVPPTIVLFLVSDRAYLDFSRSRSRVFSGPWFALAFSTLLAPIHPRLEVSFFFFLSFSPASFVHSATRERKKNGG